jgi:uncharacterized OB-fold protein
MTGPPQDSAVSVDPQRLRLTDESSEPGGVGVLVGQRCRQCQVCVFGPAIFCQACSSGDLESVQLSRQGTLFSFTVVRVPPAGWPGKVPYTLGEVELPEGPHVLAEIIDSEPDQLQLDMPMELALEQVAVAESNQGSGKVLAVYKWRPQNPS